MLGRVVQVHRVDGESQQNSLADSVHPSGPGPTSLRCDDVALQSSVGAGQASQQHALAEADHRRRAATLMCQPEAQGQRTQGQRGHKEDTRRPLRRPASKCTSGRSPMDDLRRGAVSDDFYMPFPAALLYIFLLPLRRRFCDRCCLSVCQSYCPRH